MDLFFQELSKQIINNWFIIVIICIIALCKLFLLIKNGKLHKLTIGKLSAEFFKNSKKSGPLHKDCPHVKDLVSLVAKVSTATAKITVLKTNTVISLQMNCAEENFLLLKDKMLNRYMTVLNERLNGDRISANIHYKNYSLALSVLVERILDGMKSEFLHENFLIIALDTDNLEHFTDMVENRVSMIKTDISKFFDNNYTGDVVITRNDLQEVHRQSDDLIEDITRKVFNRARYILTDKFKEIALIQGNLKKYLVECIGLESDLNFDII